ncbi:Hypothetical protein LUCI_2033 [Lucifera butyrica]|uniref:Protochlamydia outer membrane protein domain-containing protein n=1 Tax=Lucifera butyrica TaxID=1351585 RepID=A0A498R7C3_9FIRM|nr:hypothetical protein [Lucifera butyrica]VBB06797.1 Hypothetical protein LUCI_2033 [Lucifera butyrica]
MHKLCKLLTLLLSITLLLSSTALAASLSIGTWHVTGSQMWHISFSPNGASRLFYPHSGTYVTGTYENNLTKQKQFSVELGYMGQIAAATGSDSDWDYTQNNNLQYYGEFKTGGQSMFLNVNWQEQLTPVTQFLYGYSYHNSRYQMTDGTYYTENYVSTTDTLSNLNSTYSITAQGPHLGLAVHKPLSPSLAVFGSLIYSPFALVQGHGWWNLRNLDFVQTGPGQMLDGQIGLQLQNKRNLFTIGYRYQSVDVTDGSENTSSDIVWDKARSTLKGFYFAGTAKF